MGTHTPSETALGQEPAPLCSGGTGRKAGGKYIHSCIGDHANHTLHGFIEYSNVAYILVSL